MSKSGSDQIICANPKKKLESVLIKHPTPLFQKIGFLVKKL